MNGSKRADYKACSSVARRIVCSALLAVSLSIETPGFAQSFGQGFGNGLGQSLQQGFSQGSSTNALENPALLKQAPKFLDKERTLEDFFPKTDTTYGLATPYDMTGLKVTGLDPKYSPALGQNRFIVVENTPYSSMADIYRENRLKGKSNFVTADCIVHPYFALHNYILRAVIYEKVMPGLSLMLQSMLKEASADYKEADDPEVKSDIGKNVAYLLVALRLLDPTLKVTIGGTTGQLVDAELKNVAAGKTAKSAIFGNEEDYAFFHPCGFYDRESKLKNFYRCRQWLSRIQFPLTDSDLNEKPQEGQPESRFRQSVLLFRCLDKATINGAPAMDYWNKFYKVWQMMGARENAREHPLLPSDYKAVFRTSSQNLSNVLQGLSEPFFRTKLLLSIRKNRPMELNSTSILTLKKKENEPVDRAVFRMMPLADEPELPWFAELAQGFTEQKGATEATPFSLLELYARGSTLATNILGDICWKLDGELFKTLPKLIEDTSRKRAVAPAPLDAGSQEGRWAILSNYFKPVTETTQNVFKTDLWMRRRLLSAFAGWVDSHAALASLKGSGPGATLPATKNATGASVTIPLSSSTPLTGADITAPAPSTTSGAVPVTGTDANAAARPAAGNYLEPAPNLFKSVRAKMQQTLDDLSSIDYLPASSKLSAQELINLCQRLEEIAKKEQTSNFVSAQDSRYLGDIDQVLDKIPAPTQSTFHLESDTVTDKNGKVTSGANLCIGKPGLIFVLLRIGRKETLCRGAVYTYYEVAGGPIKPEHWERKLQFTMSPPPKWTSDFEVQQPSQELVQPPVKPAVGQ